MIFKLKYMVNYQPQTFENSYDKMPIALIYKKKPCFLKTKPGNLDHTRQFCVWLHDNVHAWLPTITNGQNTFAFNVKKQHIVVFVKCCVSDLKSLWPP